MLKLKKKWKITGGICLAAIVTCVVFAIVNASTTVKITMVNVEKTIASGVSRSMSVNMSGLDNDADPDPANIRWSSEKPGVVEFVDASGTVILEPTGNSATVRGRYAGVSKVSATYYARILDADGTDTGSVLAASTTSLDMMVPIEVTLSDPMVAEKILNVGDMVDIVANTSAINPMVVTTSNEGVVEVNYDPATNPNHATLLVVGGGACTVTVTTQDATGQDALTYSFVIKSKVEFDASLYNSTIGEKVYVVKNIGEHYTIPSNVKQPSTAGLLWQAEDDSIVKIYDNGEIEGLKAGVTKVTAGVKAKDVDGNVTFYNGSADSVVVVVPFMWINSVDTMNVSDQFQLECNGNMDQLAWATSDNSVLTVDQNGLVTAVGPGTAKISVTRPTDLENQTNTYDEIFTIEVEITVIDTFGLSTTRHEVNVGESFDLKALVTDKTAKISFKVYNINEAGGDPPTYDIVSTSQSSDGITLTVTGVQAGTVRIVATQNINGLIKTAECLIYVRTPVGEVMIDPEVVTLNRGETTTVQLKFDPSSPYNDAVLWTTSNSTVATVTGDSRTATIRGVKGGSATISVITMDGLKVANCEVYVREPVTGLKLNETQVNSTMDIGRYQLAATVLPEGDGVNRNVTWLSSNESVVKVDKNGLVTFVAPGYASIICQTEDNAYVATCNFYICIPVESLTLDFHDIIMSKGDHQRLTAEVLPLDATNRTVEWSSSNENVVTVDTNGQLTAVGTGNATILCKSLDGGATDMCNVYVKQPATSVVLNTNATTVRKGAVFWLNATVLPENADNKIIEWSVTNSDILSVDQDGKVTALMPGVASVVATNTDTGLNAYCVVTVTQPVTGITLNSSYQEMWVGSKYAIIPYIEPVDADNKNVTYESSDPEVASVNDKGVVTALKGGECIIVVTTEECQLTATVAITVKEYVSSIELSENNILMNIGSDKMLTADVQRPSATNRNVIWTSSRPDVASVDDEGYIKANNYGYAVITVTAEDGSGVSDSCIVRVIEPVSSIRVVPESVSLLVGDSAIVQAQISPENASIKDVTWVSSDESIAYVDQDGEIFAVSPGKCKVTAISKDGNEVKGSCSVYVKPVVPITSLKLNSKELSMLTGKSRQLTVRITPTNTTESVSWYSTDTSVVVVDQNGVITTVGPGTAEVVVTGGTTNIEGSCIIHAMELSKTNITIGQYDPFDLYVDGAVKDVSWRSSNPRVATVDQNGRVVGRMCGTTTITATVEGKTMTCKVKVIALY